MRTLLLLPGGELLSFRLAFVVFNNLGMWLFAEGYCGGSIRLVLVFVQPVPIINTHEHPHLYDGYAVTSHSSQGATAERVLVHVDTESAHEKLPNTRPACVSISRALPCALIYTNEAEKLGEELSREVSKRSALEAGMKSSGHRPRPWTRGGRIARGRNLTDRASGESKEPRNTVRNVEARRFSDG